MMSGNGRSGMFDSSGAAAPFVGRCRLPHIYPNHHPPHRLPQHTPRALPSFPFFGSSLPIFYFLPSKIIYILFHFFCYFFVTPFGTSSMHPENVSTPPVSPLRFKLEHDLWSKAGVQKPIFYRHGADLPACGNYNQNLGII
jgi:hypothetical protein